MRSVLSRRAALRLGGAALLGTVAACSEAAPGPGPPTPSGTTNPSVPTGTTAPDPLPEPARLPQVADEAALLAALERTRAVRGLASGVGGLGPGAARALRETREGLALQEQVLVQLLEAAEVTVPVPDPPPDDSSVTSAPGARSLAELAEALAADVTPGALSDLASVSTDNLALLVSITAQRGAAAVVLGRASTWAPLRGPTGAQAVPLLRVLRPAVYALEVAAARSGGQERDGHERALRVLDGLTTQLTPLAGAAAPPAPLGYALTQDVGDAEQRRALVADTLAALPPTVVEVAGTLGGDPAGVGGCVQVLVEALVVARTYGPPVPAFPGLSLPTS